MNIHGHDSLVLFDLMSHSPALYDSLYTISFYYAAKFLLFQ